MDIIRNQLQSTSIRESISPYCFILKIFGLFPFQIDKYYKVHVTQLHQILMITYVGLYFCLFSINVIIGEQEPEIEPSLLLKHGSHKSYLFELAFLTGVPLFNYFMRDNFAKCLKLFNNFDSYTLKDSNFTIKLNHNKHKTIVIYFIIASVIWSLLKINFSIIALDAKQKDFSHLFCLGCYIVSRDMTAFLSGLFTFVCYSLKTRYNILNEYFRINFGAVNFETDLDVPTLCELIDSFELCHNYLTSSIKTINLTCSLLVLFKYIKLD